MKFYILLLIQLLVLFGNESGFSRKSKSICYNYSAGVVHEICCLHFELIDSICKECKVGYYRIPTARKCKSCPPNLYGKKCASVCNCKDNERCDSVNGTCIPWTSTLGTFNYYSTVMQYQSTGENERKLGANHTRSKINNNQRTTKNSWPRLNYIYVTAGGTSLIMLCMCASFVIVKIRSRMSDVGIIMPLVNECNTPVLNQSVEAVSLNMLFHDYEEIDETVLNCIPEFRTIQFEESDSGSTEGLHSEPTEDDEGYLHPYHSLILPETKTKISNRSITRQDGSTKMDHSQYDCLILSKPTDMQLKKTISIDAILKTKENRNECTTSDRKTI